ncbi:MAG: NADPH-dependent FMN reductase [Verrucomicrobia bacterium]|nr:MAG: NADPH-dependent FMN reductase [Verrucomicrobiota bacterium]
MRLLNPKVRTGQGSTRLSREEFQRRWKERFYDPAFAAETESIDRLAEIAWQAYEDHRKSPRTRKAGPEFTDPEYELALEWLEARQQIFAAQKQHEDPKSASRILLICGSPRTDETCPSEMSKSFRIAKTAKTVMEAQVGFQIDLLDLSNLAAEYGRVIYPCKACVSTAMPLCHWPCSCYPNHYLGQSQDWMNEIYPRWVAAHGVMIVCPVHWYHSPSVLKLMMDRLVCADGGNPDPTTTHGKTPEEAKAIELKGWDYPKHLKGRMFSVIVHGDAVGAERVCGALHDWLMDLELVPAGATALLDRYIGYYEPYATSHEALDKDDAFMEEAKNAARTLLEAVNEMRRGRREPGRELPVSRKK